MAKKSDWDFRCPQYLDFLAGVDSNSEDSFLDCSDYKSPAAQKITYKSSPVSRGLTEEDENKLMNKMTAALSFIEKTPNLKIGTLRRGKLFSMKTDMKNCALQQSKPLINCKTVPVLPARMRSKSVCVFNESCTDKLNKPRIVRRSSSLNDLRTVKKHTCPKTPLCLKRTIKAKAAKVVAKTTEELELEEISKLQRQLIETLRKNEISYRKLCGQRPYIAKNPETKSVNPKGNTAREQNADKNSRQNCKTMNQMILKKKGLKIDCIINEVLNKGTSSKLATNIPSDALDKPKNQSTSSSVLCEESEKVIPANSPVCHKKIPFFRKTMNPVTLKNKAMKLNSVINGASVKGTSSRVASNILTDIIEKTRDPAVSSNILSEKSGKSQVSKKPIKYACHSGVMFNDSMKKFTDVKPFTFDSKIKEKFQNVVRQNSEVNKLCKSKSDMGNGKENFLLTGPQASVKKLLDIQNINNVKIHASKNKVIGPHSKSSVRGPLTENFARN